MFRVISSSGKIMRTLLALILWHLTDGGVKIKEFHNLKSSCHRHKNTTDILLLLFVSFLYSLALPRPLIQMVCLLLIATHSCMQCYSSSPQSDGSTSKYKQSFATFSFLLRRMPLLCFDGQRRSSIEVDWDLGPWLSGPSDTNIVFPSSPTSPSHTNPINNTWCHIFMKFGVQGHQIQLSTGPQSIVKCTS